MEPPTKRLKRSQSEVRPTYIKGPALAVEPGCATPGGIDEDRYTVRERTPTPTLTERDRRRRYVFDGSARKGRAMQPRIPTPIIVPRAPEATVTATAVDVNVQDGNSTIANTIIDQTTDATTVSFTSLGIVTVSAQTTTLGTNLPSTLLSNSTQASISSSSIGSSNAQTVTVSPLPLTPDNNSSAISTSDITRTVTWTSTLNVAFYNGTAVTLSNTPDTIVSATATSSQTQTGSLTEHSHLSKTLSAFSFAGSVYSTAPSSVDARSTSTASPTVTSTAGSSSALISGPGVVLGSGPGSQTTSTTSSSSTTSSHSGSGTAVPTPEVVGGLLGGVAGLAVILLVILSVLRMYRKRLAARGQLPEQIAARSVAPGGPGTTNPMTQRPPRNSLGAAFLSSAKRLRPQSSATTATAVTKASVPESERGFQRIAGRKIAPVIGSGSDQYGGNYGAFERDGAAGPAGVATRDTSDKEVETGLADSSFYRDSRGFYGGRGEYCDPVSPTLVSSSQGQHTRGSTRDFANTESIGEDPRERTSTLDSYAVMRPSPARTPVTNSPAASSLRLPIQQGPSMEPGAPPTPALPPHLAQRRQDAVGRSLASQDGSTRSTRSRFTESV